MPETESSKLRDALIAAAPEHETAIRTRHAIGEQYAKDHGTTVDELTIDQIMAIRQMPEWQTASA